VPKLQDPLRVPPAYVPVAENATFAPAPPAVAGKVMVNVPLAPGARFVSELMAGVERAVAAPNLAEETVTRLAVTLP